MLHGTGEAVEGGGGGSDAESSERVSVDEASKSSVDSGEGVASRSVATSPNNAKSCRAAGGDMGESGCGECGGGGGGRVLLKGGGGVSWNPKVQRSVYQKQPNPYLLL